MEKNTFPCRTAGLFSSFPNQGKREESQALLDRQKMPPPTTQTLPRLGVSGRQALLVHQRHNLRMQDPGKLAGENEDLPGLRSAVGLALSFFYFVKH